MSQHSFRRRAFRLLSLCLCAMMLFSGAAVGEAPATTVEDPVTALPTPTPEPTLPPIDKTEVEEAPPTPTPTAEPTQAPGGDRRDGNPFRGADAESITAGLPLRYSIRGRQRYANGRPDARPHGGRAYART